MEDYSLPTPMTARVYVNLPEGNPLQRWPRIKPRWLGVHRGSPLGGWIPTIKQYKSMNRCKTQCIRVIFGGTGLVLYWTLDPCPHTDLWNSDKKNVKNKKLHVRQLRVPMLKPSKASHFRMHQPLTPRNAQQGPGGFWLQHSNHPFLQANNGVKTWEKLPIWVC